MFLRLLITQVYNLRMSIMMMGVIVCIKMKVLIMIMIMAAMIRVVRLRAQMYPVKSDVFDEFELGLYGLKDLCFEEEVGLRDDDGVDSQMMNGQKVREREGSAGRITNDNEMVGFLAAKRFVEDTGIIKVTEEYDKGQIYQTDEELLGKIRPFPTDRRPTSYRRKLKEEEEEEVRAAWFAIRKITLGEKLKEKERKRAMLLLYTWEDDFANALKDMPITDLVEYQIPVKLESQHQRAPEKVFSKRRDTS